MGSSIATAGIAGVAMTTSVVARLRRATTMVRGLSRFYIIMACLLTTSSSKQGTLGVLLSTIQVALTTSVNWYAAGLKLCHAVAPRT